MFRIFVATFTTLMAAEPVALPFPAAQTDIIETARVDPAKTLKLIKRI